MRTSSGACAERWHRNESKSRGWSSLIATTICPPDTDMDDLRNSFYSLKEGIKRRLKGSKRKADIPGAGGSGETIGPSGLLLRPGPAVVTGGNPERERNEPNVGDERVGLSVVLDENKPDWKAGSAKLLLRGVRDSADAFGPLKAVAGGLCFILENCEVCFPSINAAHNAHGCCSVRRQTDKS